MSFDSREMSDLGIWSNQGARTLVRSDSKLSVALMDWIWVWWDLVGLDISRWLVSHTSRPNDLDCDLAMDSHGTVVTYT